MKTYEPRVVDGVQGRFTLLDFSDHQRADEAMSGTKDVVQMNDIGRLLTEKPYDLRLRTPAGS
jgi:hypothetical protein